MVLSENTSNTTSEKRRNESNRHDKKGERPMTKIIVRRLPPSMTQQEFLIQVSPIPDYDYIYSIKGDLSLGENAFSRVYVNFTNPEDVYMFKEKFDNYVFVDTKGHEYAAVVEYAAFQKVPKRRKPRPDPKMCTIEKDPVYLEFLESLKEQPNQDEKPEYSYVINSTAESKNDGTTPLLDYLRQRKQERNRVREEKREERRKKEMERKRQKRLDEKKFKSGGPKEGPKKEDKDDKRDSNASGGNVESESKKSDEKPITEKTHKLKTKYEERKASKGKFAGSKYEDRKDFKSRRDEYRDNHHKKIEEKRPETQTTKKVKKYSEKREERKIVEASKEVAKKEMENAKKLAAEKGETAKDSQKSYEREERPGKSDQESDGCRNRNRESDPRVKRRIRNKDRPTMAIYKPGMLRKKSVDHDGEEKPDSSVECEE